MDGSAEPALGACNREALARALHAWRSAERLLAHPVFAADRSAYEGAVRALHGDLRRFRSVGDLVGYRAVEGRVLHAAVTAACSGPDDARLLVSVVEGAAFRRRVRELVAETVARPPTGEPKGT
jgi:hypothetical protein